MPSTRANGLHTADVVVMERQHLVFERERGTYPWRRRFQVDRRYTECKAGDIAQNFGVGFQITDLLAAEISLRSGQLHRP